jgi:hypothetical protein
MKNLKDRRGNRTRDFLDCSAVPQAAALPPTLIYIIVYIIKCSKYPCGTFRSYLTTLSQLKMCYFSGQNFKDFEVL